MTYDEVRLAFMCAEIQRKDWYIALENEDFDNRMFDLCNKRAERFLAESKAYKEAKGGR